MCIVRKKQMESEEKDERIEINIKEVKEDDLTTIKLEPE